MSDGERRYRDKSRNRDVSRDRRDSSRDRKEGRGHKKSDTLSVDPSVGGRGSRSRGNSVSRSRDTSPVPEVTDRSFGGGGYGGIQGSYSPATPPPNAYGDFNKVLDIMSYDEILTRTAGQYPPQPEAPIPPAQAPYGAPPPAAYGAPAPYGSIVPPTHTTSQGYQYQMPPAPIPPPPQGYGPPPPSADPSQTNPDYYSGHKNPEYWPGSTVGGPSSPHAATGGIGGPGSYMASAPPPLPPSVSPGLGPHHGNPLPPPSPNIGPHYTASPAYAPPTQYGSGGPPPHQPSHGHASSLSIPGMAGLSLGGASPALQPYQGTYQNISPLPSPSASPISYSPSSSSRDLSTQGFSLGAPLIAPPPIAKPSSNDDRDADYDPIPHAKELLACLNHNISRVDPGPIIKILPRLSPTQLIALRAEYKRLFHQVNIAKHIKMQCGTGAFGKIAWATALGPYESEGWFANSWYQKAISRNELLIEALVGKTVQEIRKIKKGFKDDKYGNSLERAVKSELAAHKFRGVILMTLDTESGIRDEEPEHQGYLGSVWGHAVQAPGCVKMDRVQEDVNRLYEVLDGRPGTGEMVLMQILLCRSQVHLREVIRWYRGMYGKDLSRVVIKHSPNLVVCDTLSFKSYFYHF